MTSKEAIDKLEHLINSPVGREEIDETCFEVMKYIAAQEPIEARLHLCDSCKNTYPECDAKHDDIMFGCGVGNDNVIGCAAYENRWKAQEPRVMKLRELAFYDSGLYVETHNGCPEGLTDELWPALTHLYCVSQNGECGYVSFINWNADTYDFEAKDYNVEFRCWTSRPTEAQREVTPWN